MYMSVSASSVIFVPFIRDTAVYDDKDEIVRVFSELVERNNVLIKFNEILMDIDKAIFIEAGIFEFAMVYVTEKKLVNTNQNDNPDTVFQSFFELIYNDKYNDILTHLTELNPNLINTLNVTECQKLAFMTHEQLFPQNWSDYNKKKELNEYKQKNLASTDLYTCYKCGEKKCQIRLLQTRSADEPMTNFITCLVCGNTFKK